MRTATLKTRHALVLATVLGMIAVTLAMVHAQEASAFPGANGKIAFAQDEDDIWTMNADGSGQGVFRSEGIEPAWSADGQMLAFSDIGDGTFDITTINADGSGEFTVTDGLADHDPVWSPDGNWIAFSRRIALPNPGAGAATLANPAGTLLTDTVTPTPFVTVQPGMTVTNTTTGSTATVLSTTATSVTTTPLDPLAGGWAIGNTYTISAEVDRVHKIMANGTGEALLGAPATVANYYNDYTPAWSPDGTKIAFSTSRGSNDDVYWMTTTGTTPTPLTTDILDHSWDPAWSPDGTKIVFTSAKTGSGGSSAGNIWTMNADGTGKAILTDVATHKDEAASWSPDGTTIVFERTTLLGGDESIYSVPAGGGTAAALTANAGKLDSRPDWQPTLAGVADAYNVDEGDTLVVPAAGVLTNDLLFADGVGAATAVKDTDPANGTVTLNSTGGFTYTHNGSETTTDSFTYHPVQGGIAGAVATVTITVDPVNDTPVAVDDGPFGVKRGDSVSRPAPGVLGNDIDDGPLTAVKVTDPAHGSVTLNADGSFTYTHNGDSALTDSFTYQAKDGSDVLSNTATVSFNIGAADTHTVGLIDPSQGKWYLYDDAGVLESEFFYGVPGDYPFMGDWDGDGVETPGLYRQSDGFVYLSNSNTAQAADITFFFGIPGDVPIAGDFNGDGFDTVSIYRPGEARFFIINELGEDGGGLGAAEFDYYFGDFGDKPFVGDFDGDGSETVGLHRESTGFVYYRNEHSTGIAQNQFYFGDPGDRLIAGDWTGDGVFSPGLFRPSNTTMYFKHTNTQGNADSQFVPSPGNPTWLPVSGIR